MNYGFYHVSWAAPGSQKTHQQQALTRTAGRGCTLLHLSHLGEVAHTRRLLRLAEGRGMTLIVKDLVGPDLLALQDTPNLIHSVKDDANAKPLAEIQGACAASAVARRYVSIGPSLKDNCAALYGLTETIGVQSYPFGGADQLHASWLIWKAARTQADLNRATVIGNAQLHPLWAGMPLPTPRQITAQVWVAAACGLDGLLGYTLIDQQGPLSAEMEEHFCAVCAQVSRFAPGRPLTTAIQSNRLTATWAGGVQVVIDLQAGAVVSLRTRE
ncbi:hypothetical protein [Deinococcus frigens]|uniref:hypothetical protein n=1 Tax=Deinococcus frigens TaxID=249403 RepID=UPI000497EF12|nr:hypothetical protein [Deinococcus frigens]